MNDKEADYSKQRGGKYMKRDDFKQYAANLRGKNAQFKQMKKVLGEIKSEVTILDRTEKILKDRSDNLDDFMKQLEKKKGIAGYSNIENQIVGVSENKEALDNKKDQTLQEITKIVSDIEEQVREKKAQLAPEIKKLRALRQKHQDLEVIYNDKKRGYDNIVMNLDQDKSKIETDAGTQFEEYRTEETKYHWHNIQNEVYDAFLKRIQNEAKYISQPDKKLSQEFKSYTDFFNAKVSIIFNTLVETTRKYPKRPKESSAHDQGQLRELWSSTGAFQELERTS